MVGARWFVRTVVALSLLSATAGCFTRGNDNENVRLMPLESCEDAEAYMRQGAINRINAQVEAARQNALTWATRDNYGTAEADSAGAPSEPQAEPGPNPDDSASEYSETNNQVSGVDEADFIKNDGSHIFVVASGTFQVLDAWPVAGAQRIARQEIEGTPRKLFVHNDRAVVFSSLESFENPTRDSDYGYGAWRECTYGYGCQFIGDGRPTKVTVFDVSDRANPVLAREIYLSGSLISARRINDAVHVVVSDQGATVDGVRTWPSGPVDYQSTASINAAFAALKAQNAEAINAQDARGWLPYMKVRRADGAERDNVQMCQGYYASTAADGGALTSLVTFDVNSERDPDMASIVSSPGVVYASGQALYLAVPHRTDPYYYYDSEAQSREETSIHKFRLEGASNDYRGSGTVVGRVLNQFALDEHAEHLRVATTRGQIWGSGENRSESFVSVLRETSGELALQGRVGGIGPGEDIRSVRFEGDRGFVVTFKKTDPLYMLDFSRPSDPRVTAELKIPGFSTYMHFMDDTHLLTIGYDADDQGSFAWFQGVMLQIFDVSSPENLALVHKEVIGTRGSSSVALTNHLAFNYFAPKNTLALPMTICEDSGGGGSYGQTMTFSGLLVYDVTVEGGFSKRGGVTHDPSADVDCNNWWTDANSQVKRSVIMDDFVYSVSETRIKGNALGDLTVDLADIDLAN